MGPRASEADDRARSRDARPGRPATAAAAVGLVALLAGAALVLGSGGSRLADVNPVAASGFGLVLEPGARICQPGELVPAEATALRINVGTFGAVGQPLAVTVAGRGAAVRRGRISEYADGAVVGVPLSGRALELDEATVCVRNEGRRRVALAGSPEAFLIVGRGGDRRVRRSLHLAYLLPEERSGFALVGSVAERFGRAKAGFVGAWTFWLAALLVLAAALVALLVTVRSVSLR